MESNPEERKDLVSFGDINADYTPIFRRGFSKQRCYEMNLGGTASNVAVAAARLGANTSFVGKVGDDFMGRFLRRELQSNGVDCASLLTDPDLFTSHVFVSLFNGERSFSFAVDGSASLNVNMDELDLDKILNTRMLYVAGVSFVDAPLGRTAHVLLSESKKRGIPVAIDMNYRETVHKSPQKLIDALNKEMANISILKGSVEDFDVVFGTRDLEKVSHLVNPKGVRLLIMTEDARGASWALDGEEHGINGFRTNLIDTTGAGDCFMGAFLYSLLHHCDLCDLKKDELNEMIRFANAAASLCVEGYGAVEAMPYPAEVEERNESQTVDERSE